jgi:hypothetical protein
MVFERQLSDDYTIPAYAQDMLYVVSGDNTAQSRGKYGKFTLDQAPDRSLGLTWGAGGPTLVVWTRAPESSTLRWDGRVKVGGFIERFHGLEIGGLEVVVAEVVGGPFPIDHVGLPSLDDVQHGIFARPSDVEPLGRDQAYPFVILAESNLAALAQDALVSGLAVDAYGSLAGEAGRWHEVVGLPLLLDSLTILAP